MKFSIWEMLLATAMGIMIGCALQWGPLDDSEEQPTAVKREPSGTTKISRGIERIIDERFNNVCYYTSGGKLSCLPIQKFK